MVAASWMMVALSCAFVHVTGMQEPEPDGSGPRAARGAAADTVALEPVRFVGTRDERVAQAFAAGLREHIEGAVRLAPACAEAPCPSADTTVRVEVDERERDYAMTIAVLHGDGHERARRTVSCEVCTPDEAAATAGTTAIELLRGADALARLDVVSTPIGAEIWLDGERSGTTPAEITTAAGLHTIELRKAGHVSRARELDLAAGSRGSLRIELAVDRRGATARNMRIAGWTLVGIGVAAVIGGSILVAIDEKPIESDCEGSHVDRFGNCEYRWNTVAGGATLLVGGLAAAGSGAALVVVGNRRGRAELRGGPTHASITVRF